MSRNEYIPVTLYTYSYIARYSTSLQAIESIVNRLLFSRMNVALNWKHRVTQFVWSRTPVQRTESERRFSDSRLLHRLNDTCQNTRRLVFLPRYGPGSFRSLVKWRAINLDETGWDKHAWIKRRQLEARVIGCWHLPMEKVTRYVARNDAA